MLILIGPRSIYGNKGALEHLKDNVRFAEEQVGQSVYRAIFFQRYQIFSLISGRSTG